VSIGTSLRRVAAVAACDLRLTLRDRGSLFWLLIAPAIWVYFTGLMARPPAQHKGGKPSGPPLAVCDMDRSTESAKLIKSLQREGFTVSGIDSCEQRPERTSCLTIPQGMGQTIENDRKAELSLTPPGEGVSTNALAVQVRAHKAVVRYLADRALGTSGTDATDAVRVHAYYLQRRAIPVGFQQAVPGNLVLFLLMMTIASGAETLARERRRGILRRLAATALTRAELLAGKFAGRLGVAVIEIGVFMAIGTWLFRVAWGASPPALFLVLACLAVCAAALSLAAGAVARSPDAASGISIVVILLMAGLGGCWWPSEIVPEWIQHLGLAFPTGWAMEGLQRVMSWGGGVRDVIVPSLALLGFATVAFAVALWRLRLEES
jgi:ABC-2 type transport system permease protein